jgi:hypothetical protein
MGRSRGKGKKTMEATSNDEEGSGSDEAGTATSKRRGRPQKPPPPKDGADEVGDTAKSEGNGDDARIKPVVPPDDKDPMSSSAEAGSKKKKKRRRQHLRRTSDESAAEDELHRVKSKPSGFRQIGSRRKSTPRRAAEAGVDATSDERAPN